jgi:hypothetical protein
VRGCRYGSRVGCADADGAENTDTAKCGGTQHKAPGARGERSHLDPDLHHLSRAGKVVHPKYCLHVDEDRYTPPPDKTADPFVSGIEIGGHPV